MRDLGIAGARSGRKRPRTTVPGDPAGMPDDLLDRLFFAAAPNLRWVADITYVEGYQKLSSASFRGSPSNC